MLILQDPTILDKIQVFLLFLPGVRGPSPWNILKTKNTGEAICAHFAMQLKSYDSLATTRSPIPQR